MSRFGPMCCYRCGYMLDDKYEAFSYMKSIMLENAKSRSHIDKRLLDTHESISVNIIFDVLKIRPEKYCCRACIMTTVLPSDLETRNMSRTHKFT